MTFRHLIFSPNLIWLVITIAVYLVCPYDLEAAKHWEMRWIMRRVLVNMLVMFAYYLFWEVALYSAQWSQRKFSANVWPSTGKIAHNVGWSLLGTLQWVGWEVAFVRMFATGQLPFMSDEELLSSPWCMLQTFLWIAAIPLWRGIHFYFAHRLIHVNMLYRFVHSLHHRNLDIEPFAGLSMHPVEHLYYFSCLAPSLYFRTHPIVFLFNGMHLVLSPAASHSGWEDHWQSDQFHYMHHAQFECNYGSASVPLDFLFGTFREKRGRSSLYAGAAQHIPEKGGVDTTNKPGKPKVQIQGIKNGGPPGFWLYMIISSAMICAPGIAAWTGTECTPRAAKAIASCCAFGPVLLAAVMLKVLGDHKSARWPFHNEAVVGRFGGHLLVGFMVAVLPAYHAVAGVLTPGTGEHFQVWLGLDGALCFGALAVVGICLSSFWVQ
eukprot:TRINITY_DN20873_c0_g1_i1.p1 TRINITY_DN20873_c0_g1~~TRINITY_DN20873_c0_g1_i1.p1  ORF type:complete len:435 (-),score=68.61 TRINITY_DN20873_c0_g1_i1:190-1494(-)